MSAMAIAREALAAAEKATRDIVGRGRFVRFVPGKTEPQHFNKQPSGDTANVYVRADVSGHMLARLSRLLDEARGSKPVGCHRRISRFGDHRHSPVTCGATVAGSIALCPSCSPDGPDKPKPAPSAGAAEGRSSFAVVLAGIGGVPGYRFATKATEDGWTTSIMDRDVAQNEAARVTGALANGCRGTAKVVRILADGAHEAAVEAARREERERIYKLIDDADDDDTEVSEGLKYALLLMRQNGGSK